MKTLVQAAALFALLAAALQLVAYFQLFFGESAK
jgi:hypothetical protein